MSMSNLPGIGQCPTRGMVVTIHTPTTFSELSFPRVFLSKFLRDTSSILVIIWVNFFQTEKTMKIQLVRPIEVYGKV